MGKWQQVGAVAAVVAMIEGGAAVVVANADSGAQSRIDEMEALLRQQQAERERTEALLWQLQQQQQAQFAPSRPQNQPIIPSRDDQALQDIQDELERQQRQKLMDDAIAAGEQLRMQQELEALQNEQWREDLWAKSPGNRKNSTRLERHKQINNSQEPDVFNPASQ